jgi:IS1 family transposase
MNRLDPDKRVKAIAALVEGNSIRAVSRMTGIARNTITDLLVALGEACAEYQDKTLRKLPCKRIQCDEIWAFCYAKEKNVPVDKQGKFGFGSIWTWTAIDADTKLIASWMVGPRDVAAATEFMRDLEGRLANRVQLTTDGHKPYLEAVDYAFSGQIDYAMLVKIYGESGETEKRYSPAAYVASEKRTINGSPEKKHISTSYVERQNLTMRMHMRRFTRLTNGFSKKLENHIAAVSLHFMHYNFVRIHQTLRMSPAMAAGVTDRLWEISDIVRLLEEREERLLAEAREEKLKSVYRHVLPPHYE